MSKHSTPTQKDMSETVLDKNQLREAIREEYEAVANNPSQGFHFHTGRKLTRILGYNEKWLERIPESSIESFAGTGNPFSIRPIKPNENVVDVGCGAGMDSLIAAQKVAPNGHVVGVDMTKAMVDKARASAAESGIENVDFRLGFAEALPIDDEWADVIISNGVFNLTPDKLKTLREMNRVLKPNGRLQIGDILIKKPVPFESMQTPELWTGCIAGALLEYQLRVKVISAGFVDLQIVWWANVYDGAPQSSSANTYGTVGINFYARKAADKKEWEREMESIPMSNKE